MAVDLVAAAITHFGLETRAVRPVPDSFSSTVRLLDLASGEQLVLKIPYVKQKLTRELDALTALQGDLPVPDVVDVWIPDDEGSGALLLSRLPGTNIPGAVSPDLAHQMGVLLAGLHTHKRDHYGDTEEGDEPNAHDWWAMYRARLEMWRPFCEEAMPPDLLASSLALYETLAADLPDADGPCWVHCDYRPGNILVEDGTITGLFDFESARGGAADLDFAKISHEVWELDPATRPVFLAGYGQVRPVPPLEQTLALYQLHNALGGVAWCVRRTDTNDPFLQENLDVVRRLTDRMAS